MNQNEREQLSRFLNQLRQARVDGRNSEADRLIREAVADNSDAAYLLVQRAMLMEQALENAKTQIAQLRQQVARRPETDQGGFPSRNNPWANGIDSARDTPRVPGGGGYQVPRAAPSAGNASTGPSFLGSVASTAAGVVAGSFLFQGIENLLGHHSASSGFEPAGERVAEETTINNYYGADAGDTGSQPDNADAFLADDADAFGDDSFLDDTDDSSWV